MKELYEKNVDFRLYVDSFCVKHGISIEEAFEQELVKRVAIYYNFFQKDKVEL